MASRVRIHKRLGIEELEQRIAPVLTYGGTYTWGSPSTDTGYSIVMDAGGNIYVVGSFSGTNVDFDPGPGVELHSSAGGLDVFFSRYDANHNYLGTTTFGGSGTDDGLGIAVDNGGNVIICGTFNSPDIDFDPGPGTAIKSTTGTSFDIFVAAYGANGDYKWANTIGGSADDWAYDVATDSASNVYFTGYFQRLSVDFNPGTGRDYHSSAGGTDGFVTKFTSSGGYGWTRSFGGPGNDYGRGIDVDSSGNVLVVGDFQQLVDFNRGGSTVYNKTAVIGSDVFVSKYDPSKAVASNHLWTRTIDGGLNDTGWDVTTDAGANVYSTGFLGATTSPTVFVARMAPDGADSASNWVATPLSGVGHGITADTFGSIYVAGQVGTFQEEFVIRYDTSGTRWSSRYTLGAIAYGIDSDHNGNVAVAGDFTGTVDFNPGGGDPHASAGATDVFLSWYNYTLVHIASVTPANLYAHVSVGSPTQIAVTFDHNVLNGTETGSVRTGVTLVRSNNGYFGDGDDVSVALTFVTYVGTTAIFTISGPKPEDVYMITVLGTGANRVVDTDGTAIDGAQPPTGQAGSDFTSKFWIDDHGPNQGTITIVDNHGYTNQATPNLTLSDTDVGPGEFGSGVFEMRFSLDHVTWTGWTAYSTTASGVVNIGPTEGLKTVYVQYRDRAYNESSPLPLPSSDTTTYDITAPDCWGSEPPDPPTAYEMPPGSMGPSPLLPIIVYFSEDSMDPSTIKVTDFIVYRSGGDGLFGTTVNPTTNPKADVKISGAITQDTVNLRKFIFTPSILLPNDLYRVTLKGTGSTVVKDYAGNTMNGNGGVPNADYVFTFTIGNGPELLITDSDLPNNDGVIDYGFLGVGGTKTNTITIKNIGYATCTLTYTQLLSHTGPDPLDYSWIYLSGGPVIDPNQTSVIQITFNPASLGIQSDIFRIESDDPDHAQVDTTVVGMGNDGVVLNKTNPKFTYTDLDGDLVQVQYSGTGDVCLSTALFGTIDPLVPTDIGYVYFRKGTSATRLTMTDVADAKGAPPTPNTMTAGTIGMLSGTALGTLQFTNKLGTVFNTTINLAADLGTLAITGAANTVWLSLGGAASDLSRASFSGTVTNCRTIVGGVISAFQATGDVTGGLFTAGGDFKQFTASGNVSGATVTSGGTMTTARVSKAVDGGSVFRAATLKSFSAGSITDSTVEGTTQLLSASSSGNMTNSFFISRGGANLFSVRGNVVVGAPGDEPFRVEGYLKQLAVTGTITDALVTVTGDLTTARITGLSTNVQYQVGGILKSGTFTGGITGGLLHVVGTVTTLSIGGTTGNVTNGNFDFDGLVTTFKVMGNVGGATTMDFLGEAKTVQFSKQVAGATINVAGRSNNFKVQGGLLTSILNLNGGAEAVYLYGGLTGDTVTIAREPLDGLMNTFATSGGIGAGTTITLGTLLNACNIKTATLTGGVTGGDLVVFGNVTTCTIGGMNGGTVTVNGTVTTCNVSAAMDNGADLHVTGAVTNFKVSKGGIGVTAATTVRLDGNVTTLSVVGDKGLQSIANGSSVRVGGALLKTLTMSGILAGRMEIVGAAAGTTMTITGDMAATGQLMANVFGNVTINGTFNGAITAALAGTLNTLTVKTAGVGYAVTPADAFAIYKGIPHP